MLYDRGISNILEASIQYSVPERTKIFLLGSDNGSNAHSVNNGGKMVGCALQGMGKKRRSRRMQ